jgi:hypothetical protein
VREGNSNGEHAARHAHVSIARSMDADTGSGQTLRAATKQAFLDFINCPTNCTVGLELFSRNQLGRELLRRPAPIAPVGCTRSARSAFRLATRAPRQRLPPPIGIQQIPGVITQLTNALNATCPVAARRRARRWKRSPSCRRL